MPNTSPIKWVSPTGLTLMHEDGTYSFPSTPHPQPKYKDTSNKGTFGLKGAVKAANAK